MPSLTIEYLNEIMYKISEDISEYKIFVETGTYRGETVFNMAPYFDKVYTIELSKTLYENFNTQNYDKNKITSILGDSSEMLESLIKNINENTIFFLDGHFSSCGTAKGKKDVPLLEELLVINEYLKSKSIIIIDDLRLFGTNITEDWTDVTTDSVINVIQNRIIKKITLDDRLVLLVS